MFKNLYLSFDINKIYSSNTLNEKAFFRIRRINYSDDAIYKIEEIKSNYKLSFSDNKELVFNDKNNSQQLWNITRQSDNIYAIKNCINSCYIKIDKNKYYCDSINADLATHFKLIRIYSEVTEIQDSTEQELLDKEPIDILIKYIDLRDPNLTRKGIHQIEKDYDNEELRYSVRSIFKYIPWIRKIFILMPNEKVRYFKEYNSIKEKIVYVKDKDVLGHDSSNCNAFLYRYWKMKEFGISDNIIVMDDDCFIGNKLEKSDFFHVKEGKVLPSIITSRLSKIDKRSVQKKCKFYKKKAKLSKKEQNKDIFSYSKFLTFSFILNLFNVSIDENIFIPKFTHNAIPVNLGDVKEIYELIYKSKYKYVTLDCLYRHNGYIHFQIFAVLYTFIKYEREVKNIPYKYINFANSLSSNYKYSLFCINKGAGKYSILSSYKAKIMMEYLFPNPSPYEIIDYSLINISFNTAYSLDQIVKLNKKPSSCIIKKNSSDKNIQLEKQINSQLITKEKIIHYNYSLILLFLLIYIKFNYNIMQK
jgi:frataxin-like iron-binding protein CyaY